MLQLFSPYVDGAVFFVFVVPISGLRRHAIELFSPYVDSAGIMRFLNTVPQKHKTNVLVVGSFVCALLGPILADFGRWFFMFS